MDSRNFIMHVEIINSNWLYNWHEKPKHWKCKFIIVYDLINDFRGLLHQMLSALALYGCPTCRYIWGICIPKKKNDPTIERGQIWIPFIKLGVRPTSTPGPRRDQLVWNFVFVWQCKELIFPLVWWAQWIV